MLGDSGNTQKGDGTYTDRNWGENSQGQLGDAPYTDGLQVSSLGWGHRPRQVLE